MARFDETSVLEGLHQRDAGSIRRAMKTALALMPNAVEDVVVANLGLIQLERDVAGQIHQETTHNDLFNAGARRFGSAHNADHEGVLRAAQEFSNLFVPSVLGPVRFRVQADVDAARAAFQDLLDNATPFFYPQVDFEKDDGDITDDNGSSDASEESEESGLKRKHSNSPEETTKSRKKPYKGEVDPKGPINEPFMPKGARIIKDESIDPARARRAAVGTFDPSLCKITVKVEVKVNDEWVPSPDIVYDRSSFRPELNSSSAWNDEKNIKKLNSWRSQLFLRKFGKKRQARYQWIVLEQSKFFELLRKYLSRPEVGWRYSQIPWPSIQDDFNRHFKDTVITTKDKTCATTYEVNVKKNKDDNGEKHTVVSVAQKVKHAHKFVPRTWTGMQNQLKHFTHGAAKAILKRAKKADDDFKAANAKPKTNGKGKEAKSASKKDKGKEIAQPEPDSDNGELSDVALEDNPHYIVEDDRDENDLDEEPEDDIQNSISIFLPNLPRQDSQHDSHVITQDNKNGIARTFEDAEEEYFLEEMGEKSKGRAKSKNSNDKSGGGPSKKG